MDRTSPVQLIAALIILVALTATMMVSSIGDVRLGFKPKPAHLAATARPCECTECLQIRARFDCLLTQLEADADETTLVNVVERR